MHLLPAKEKEMNYLNLNLLEQDSVEQKSVISKKNDDTPTLEKISKHCWRQLLAIRYPE